jgi:hypothetical protein
VKFKGQPVKVSDLLLPKYEVEWDSDCGLITVLNTFSFSDCDKLLDSHNTCLSHVTPIRLSCGGLLKWLGLAC